MARHSFWARRHPTASGKTNRKLSEFLQCHLLRIWSRQFRNAFEIWSKLTINKKEYFATCGDTLEARVYQVKKNQYPWNNSRDQVQSTCVRRVLRKYFSVEDYCSIYVFIFCGRVRPTPKIFCTIKSEEKGINIMCFNNATQSLHHPIIRHL